MGVSNSGDVFGSCGKGGKFVGRPGPGLLHTIFQQSSISWRQVYGGSTSNANTREQRIFYANVFR